MSLVRAMRRARAQSGHTLIELVVAMALGMGILLIAFHLLDRSLGLTREVSDRVDAVQRGRVAMDTITRQLRSQVCMGEDAALVSADADSATFYTNLGDASLSPTPPPEKQTFTFDPVANTLTQTRLKGVGNPPFTDYTAATPRKTNLLESAARNGATAATAPVFTYYGFDTSSPPRPVKQLTPMPLTQTQRESTARIVISFIARPRSAKTTNTRAAVLTDEIFVRSADPNDPAPVPKCA